MQSKNSPMNIERLMDIEMNVTVRFGLTEISLRELANFRSGSMIELDRTVDEPIELLVNNFPFARGEVVVIDGYYGVRITEIASTEERSSKFMARANTENPEADIQEQISEQKPQKQESKPQAPGNNPAEQRPKPNIPPRENTPPKGNPSEEQKN